VTKKTVDRTLAKAKRHLKKGEIEEAKNLFRTILEKFPRNVRARQELEAITNSQRRDDESRQDDQGISRLINMYNNGNFCGVIELSGTLLRENPEEFIVWNINGAANGGMNYHDKAVASYKRAIIVEPSYSDAYNNLGIAWKEVGSLEAAICCYSKSVKLNPQSPQTYNNMGNALKDLGKLDESIKSFENALHLDKHYLEAHNNIGLAFAAGENHTDALKYFKKTLKLDASFYQAYQYMGLSLLGLDNPHQAVNAFKKTITANPRDVIAYNNLGFALKSLELNKEALKSYKRAITIKIDYPEAYKNIGIVHMAEGRTQAAISSMTQALQINDNMHSAYIALADVLRRVRFTAPKKELHPIIQKLITSNNYVRPKTISRAVISLLKTETALIELLEDPNRLQNLNAWQRTIATLSEFPLLLSLMQLCPFPDLDFEQLFVDIRKFVLKNIGCIEENPAVLELLACLSVQNFINEYLADFTEEESQILHLLEKDVLETIETGGSPSILSIFCLALYRPINEYAWSEALVFPEQFSATKEILIIEPNYEQKLIENIQRFENILDPISKEVRSQYESNPYPRWIKLGLRHKAGSIGKVAKEVGLNLASREILNVSSPKILVAGCGTGQQAIETAARFKNCEVIAIDLSLRSLAYAERQTQKLGITNIKYIQADILQLDNLDHDFDIIESLGVLHHMDQPNDGWSILTRKLKKGGLFKLGLYSKVARQHILDFRSRFKNSPIPSSSKEIIKVRQQIVASNQTANTRIIASDDFYNLSEIKDLLFHVKEHHFSIPEIDGCLKNLGLHFCGFENTEINNVFKREKGVAADINCLMLWHELEINNPNLFGGMYQFWTQKL